MTDVIEIHVHVTIPVKWCRSDKKLASLMDWRAAEVAGFESVWIPEWTDDEAIFEYQFRVDAGIDQPKARAECRAKLQTLFETLNPSMAAEVRNADH